jgi:hypothetical protein
MCGGGEHQAGSGTGCCALQRMTGCPSGRAPFDELSCYAVWACLFASKLVCILPACHWLWILPPDAGLWLASRVLQRHPWSVALPAGWSVPQGMGLPCGAWGRSGVHAPWRLMQIYHLFGMYCAGESNLLSYCRAVAVCQLGFVCLLR